jgi:cellobiose-specific phosphotransferase system component IIC
MNKIDNTTSALLLIEIAYKEGKINEKTYKNIQKKYSNKTKGNSTKGNSLSVIIACLIVLLWYNGIKGRRILRKGKCNE